MHLAVLDWSVIWHAEIYLQMTYVDKLGAVGTVLVQSARAFGVVATILAAYLFATKRMGLFVLVLPLVAWHVLFDLAAHSRAVVFYFGAAGATLIVLRPRKWGAPAVMFTFALVSLVGSLAGRGSGHHGLSSLPFYLSNIVTYPVDLGNITNMFEGIFVTAEFFAQKLYYHPSYANLFPVPAGQLHRRLRYCTRAISDQTQPPAPNSAVTEVLSFGPLHASIIFGVEFLAGWLSARLLARDRSPLALIVNAVVLLACYLQFTYPTRIVFRFFVFAAVVASLAWLYSIQRTRFEMVAAVPLKPPQRRKILASGVSSPTKSRRLARAGVDEAAPSEPTAIQARRRAIAATAMGLANRPAD